MSSVTRILDAVAKHDPQAALVMAVDTWWEDAVQVRKDFYDEAVPMVLHAWEASGPRIAQRVGREYVVAKSVDADASFDPNGLLADYQQTMLVLKADDSFRGRYGNMMTVNRDARGRFSRKSQQTQSDPSSWGTDSKQRLRTIPGPASAYVQGQTDPRGNSRAVIKPGTSADQEKAVRDYLGAADEVMQLRRDLSHAVGGDNMDKYEITLYFQNGGRHVMQGEDDSLNWDMALGPVASYEVRPKAGLETAQFNTANSKLAMFENLELLGLSGQVDSATLDRLAAVANGGAGIDTPKSRRYASALKVGGDLANMIGAKGLGSAMRRSASVMEEGERFRPALTRAAYRYRGTEKRPDPDLLAASQFQFGDSRGRAQMSVADKVTMDLLGQRGDVTSVGLQTRDGRRSLEEQALEAATTKPGGAHGMLMPQVGQRVKHYQQSMYDRPATTEQLRLAVQRDMVAQSFANRLMHNAGRRAGASPEGRRGQGVIGTGDRNMDRMISDIAQNIGRGLPSEGLLIDGDGHPVAQSVGLGGDHYQPFTAASLGKLSGGQYVRSRQHGGITSDDLRTLLVTGGRAAMVVSGSGVFDIELDPSFRSQRRLSDKALGMVETYERILDQLAGQQVFSRDLDPQTKAEIRDRAKLMVGTDKTPGALADKIKDLTNERRAQEMDLTKQQVKEAQDQALQELSVKYPNASDSQKREAQEAAVQRAQEDKVRALSLNAEGYEVALRTLQRYYPYFIRDVSYRSLRDLMAASPFKEPDPSLGGAYGLAQSNASDREYVRPGATRFGTDERAVTGLPNPLSSPVNARGNDTDGTSTTSEPTKPTTSETVTRGLSGGEFGRPIGVAAGTPKREQPVDLPGPVRQLADTTANSVQQAGQLARAEFNDTLPLGSPEQDAYNTWLAAKATSHSHEIMQFPTTEPWQSAASEATLHRLGMINTDDKVFGELVEFLRSASDEDKEQLRRRIPGEAFSGDTLPDLNKTIADQLLKVVNQADAVAMLSVPWRTSVDEPFDGSPMVFPFVNAITNFADVDTLEQNPEVVQALDAVGQSSLGDVPHSKLRDRIQDESMVRAAVAANPQQWAQVADMASPSERGSAVSRLVGGNTRALAVVQELTDRFSNDDMVREVASPGYMQQRLENLERVYAAQHLVEQKQAVDAAFGGSGGGGGVDPKAWEMVLGLNVLEPPQAQQPPVAKSLSPRLTVTRFLPRNHPVSVAVNKGYRLPR
jgi:hypothetical protein